MKKRHPGLHVEVIHKDNSLTSGLLKDGGEREAKTVHFEWLNEVVKATNVKIDQFLWG